MTNLATLFTKCRQMQYTHTKGNVSYAVTRDGARLFLWFEQSNGITDWGRNLNFPARAYKSGTFTWFCHRGFLSAWKEIREHLSTAILDDSVREITIVGYSHGAAVALLCHEYVWYMRQDLRARMQGVGFGCPRVVWGYLPQAMRVRWEHFLVVRNLDDIVTHLPPALLGYFHVSPILEIGTSGQYSRVDAHRPEHYETELRFL